MNLRPDFTLIEVLAAELRAHMGDDFDEQAFIDTLDGETDFADIADRLIAERQDSAALADALAAQIDAMRQRLDRLRARDEAFKAALHKLMTAAGVRKLERPTATVSIRAGSEYVRIIHEDDVPSQLMREKVTRAPDKAAIKAALKAGEMVPGCELLRGDDNVTVRVA